MRFSADSYVSALGRRAGPFLEAERVSLKTFAMAKYNFRSLSPHDFELLCGDLLQEILGVRLESFTTGPDSRIDFRYRRQGVNLIVQCKHFADSGYGAVCHVLRKKERQKLDALAPTRYVLATSVGLTPARKNEVVEILVPYCLGPSDIVGPDDINNLLTQHGHVERRPYCPRTRSTPSDGPILRWTLAGSRRS